MPEGPTPAEFVRFANEVLFKDGYPMEDIDRHWRPYWASCPFCRIDFDIIGKMDETMQEDRDTFLNAIGAKMEDVDINWHRNKGHKGDGEVPAHVEFFSQVPREDVERLYENYKWDFLLFGYPTPDFDAYEKF